MEQPEQIKMLLDFFNYENLQADDQRRIHDILHGPTSHQKEPELPWEIEKNVEPQQVDEPEPTEARPVENRESMYTQSAAGDPGMNIAAPMQPPPNMVHHNPYAHDMGINNSAPSTEGGMYSPPGIPANMIQTVVDPATGNIMQIYPYHHTPYMMGVPGTMPPHGAAGPPSTEGYIPMMGGMMAAHGMGAHGAHQMSMSGVQVSYGMGIPHHEAGGVMYSTSHIPHSPDPKGQGPQRERRNKKKRPADYYKKLEERERIAAGEQMPEGHMDHTMSSLNPNAPPHHPMPMRIPVSVPVNVPLADHAGHPMPTEYSSYRQPEPLVYPSHMNVGITNQLEMQNASNSISFVAETMQPVEIDKNNSAIGALPGDTSAQTNEPTNNINTNDINAKPPDKPPQYHPPSSIPDNSPRQVSEDFGFSISFGSVDESMMKKANVSQSDESVNVKGSSECDTKVEAKDVVLNVNANASSSVTAQVQKDSKPDNDKTARVAEKTPDKKVEDSKVNVKDATPAKQENQTNSTGPAPEKPKSWASLLHGTSAANSATVVYDSKSSASGGKNEESKDNSSDKKESSPSPDAIVAASDDKNARQLGELLREYKAKYTPVSLLPRGLHNSNNWCYINATLQALLACPAFYHLMKALPAFPPLTRGPSSTPVIDALCEFINEFEERPIQKLDGKALNAKGTVKQDVPVGQAFSPKCIFRMLNLIKDDSQFKLGKQEDAEEFLSCMLNLLHEEMVAARKVVDEDEDKPNANGDCPEEDSSKNNDDEEDGQWEQVGPKNKSVIARTAEFEKSPVSDIFRGQIRSTVHKPGAKESATLQPFFTLQLDIQNEAVWSVKDALDGFVSKETISDHKYVVKGIEVNATRRILLEDLPKILVLHLKCFIYDKSGGCQKIIKEIEFDTEMELNKDLLSPTARSRFGPAMRRYKLVAVVNHIGARAIGGHYTADVFHPGINGWLRCDDNFINSVSAASVVKFHSPKVPYLLYYRRMDLS